MAEDQTTLSLFEQINKGDLASAQKVVKNYPASVVHSGLLNAIQKGRLDVVTLLIKAGVNVNYVPPDAPTLIEQAAALAHKEIITALIEAGADCKGEHNPIFLACEEGLHDVVELLLKLKIDPNSADDSGFTGLHFAAWKSYENIADVLLANKADINATTPQGHTAIDVAVHHDNLAIAKKLIKSGGKITLEGEIVGKALNAVDVELVEMLVERGVLRANKHLTSGYVGCLPLHIASWKGSLELVKLLLPKYPKGINELPSNRKNPPFLFACRSGNLSVVQFLLENGAKHDGVAGELGVGSLHLAAIGNNVPLAKFLLEECKCDVMMKDDKDHTPLHNAALEANLPMCELLLKHGADPTLVDQDGHTPFTFVCHATDSMYKDPQHLLVVRKFLETGKIDVNFMEKSGITALIYASQSGLTDVVEELLNRGADVKMKAPKSYGYDGSVKWSKRVPEGVTALQLAAQNGHFEVVKLLAIRGADVNAEDAEGTTPYVAAKRNGFKEIANFLVEQGAVAKKRPKEKITFNKTSGKYGVEKGAKDKKDLDF